MKKAEMKKKLAGAKAKMEAALNKASDSKKNSKS
jgi:hypothetical protein